MYLTLLHRKVRLLIFSLCRMATSKLFVDPDYLAKVEEGDWSKYVYHGTLETWLNVS